MEANWDVRSWLHGSATTDLAYFTGRVVQGAWSVYYYPVTGEASYAVCQAVTARTESIDLNDRGNATEFCLWTSDGRLAFVKVIDVHDPIAFDVIVWEKG
jgi:hypothetical protein